MLCKTADVTVKKESGDGTAARVYADDDDSIKNKGKINKTELKSGRYPEKAGECLALVPNPFWSSRRSVQCIAPKKPMFSPQTS